MSISSISNKSVYTNTSLSASTTQASANFDKPSPAQQTDAYSNQQSTQAAQIMQGYDLKNISWNQSQELGKKLFNAGLITGDQYMAFSVPDTVSIGSNSNNADMSNQKQNLLAKFNQQLDFAKQTGIGGATTQNYLASALKIMTSLNALTNPDSKSTASNS